MKTIRIITCFALSLLLANCSKDKGIENPEPLGEEVKLCAEIHNIEVEVSKTRATTIAFDNKSFQLIVRDASESNYFTEKNVLASSNAAENGSNESPVSIDPKLYWDDLGGKLAKLELFGIYPHKDLAGIGGYEYSGDNINWTVTTDIDASDLMIAHKDEYSYSKTDAANLVFEHVLTKVSINLLKGDGFDSDDLSSATVTYTVPTTGTCNIKTGIATGTNTATLTPTIANNSYSILTFPFNVGSEETYELAVLTIGSNTYKVNVKGLDLKKGVHNVFNVTINKSDITLKASLVDWDEKASTASAKLVNVGEFTIADATNAKVTDGTTIAVAITDKNSDVHKGAFTYDDNTKTWAPSTPLYWDDMAYPFTSVEALMVLGGDANGDCIFTASASNVPLGEAIALGEFKHSLVKLTITVTTTNPSAEVTNNVKLEGIQKVAIHDSKLFEIATDGVTVNEGSTALTAVRDGTTHTYVAFMTPKSLTKLCDITIKEDDNNTNIYPVNITETQFVAGNHYKYTVNITKTEVEFTGSLIDWTVVNNGGIETGL